MDISAVASMVHVRMMLRPFIFAAGALPRSHQRVAPGSDVMGDAGSAQLPPRERAHLTSALAARWASPTPGVKRPRTPSQKRKSQSGASALDEDER